MSVDPQDCVNPRNNKNVSEKSPYAVSGSGIGIQMLTWNFLLVLSLPCLLLLVCGAVESWVTTKKMQEVVYAKHAVAVVICMMPYFHWTLSLPNRQHPTFAKNIFLAVLGGLQSSFACVLAEAADTRIHFETSTVREAVSECVKSAGLFSTYFIISNIALCYLSDVNSKWRQIPVGSVVLAGSLLAVAKFYGYFGFRHSLFYQRYAHETDLIAIYTPKDPKKLR